MLLLVFIGVLRRKQEPLKPVEEISDDISVDSFDKELCSQLATLNSSPPSEFGYGYGGKAYVTQSTFWFYSFTMIACVNTVRDLSFLLQCILNIFFSCLHTCPCRYYNTDIHIIIIIII